MTTDLVRHMTDSDLLDIHYFLIDEDDFDDDGLKEGFYINLFSYSLPFMGYFILQSARRWTFLF